MLKRTALYPLQAQLNPKMSDFHGWELPMYYTSILDEHASVRGAVGLFDVSHMGQVFVRGAGALAMLNDLVVSDLSQLGPGRACYTLLLNEQGGILDDLMIYRLEEASYLVIVNCANREADVAWLQAHRRRDAELLDRSDGRAILAIQGPRSGALLDRVLPARVSSLGRFDVIALPAVGAETWVARTGYTGSAGFELFAPNEVAVRLWPRLLEEGRVLGAQPVGLGARDTLRLEAGLRLHGTDMDATTTPYEAGLGWTVAINKPAFMGRAVLLKQQAEGAAKRLVGIELDQGPMPRHGCELRASGRVVGVTTSGTFSPMLNKPIGMAMVERACADAGTALEVVVRAKAYAVRVVALPFWRLQPEPRRNPMELAKQG